MKTITVSVEDEVYRAAAEAAAQRQRSLIALVQEFIERMGRLGEASGQAESEEARKAREEFARFLAELSTQSDANEALTEKEQKRREEFVRFLAELNARPLKDGPSVGPLNREELYQRGIS